MVTTAVGPEGFTADCLECGAVRVIYREQGRPPAAPIRGDDDALHSWSPTPGVAFSVADR
jgi:hypothetical protein